MLTPRVIPSVSINSLPLASVSAMTTAKTSKHHWFGQFEQSRHQRDKAATAIAAFSNARLFGVEPKDFQHRTAALVEAGFGKAGVDALVDCIVARILLLQL